MGDKTIVVVGASLTGATAVETLREEGFDGRIVLIGSDPERPYHRPPLSKGYLRKESPFEDAYVHPANFYDQHKIELLTDTTVSAIDPSNAEVVLHDNQRIKYDRLLLAVGARPRQLSIDGAELAGVHYLRTATDSNELRKCFANKQSVVIIGAGWIGAEVAASASQCGLEVTWLEQASLPLEAVLGKKVGGFFRDLHQANDVQTLFGSAVDRLEGNGAIERVRLVGGRTIECDFLVAGIGVTPCVELAERAGLGVDNGILVNEQLATSAPNIFAAGDVANAQNTFLDRRLRIEHWANAKTQGALAAKNMLGKQTPFDAIPYFFSVQYDVTMKYYGYASGTDEVVVRGDMSRREFKAFWLSDDRVIAGMGVNAGDVEQEIKALIKSGKPIQRGRLADPDIDLGNVFS